MSTLRRWWQQRGHDKSDINCVHWNQPQSRLDGRCEPCFTSGGYVALRHAQVDAEARS